MDIMRHGISISRFQEKQQWLTISSSSLNTRFDSQLDTSNNPGVGALM